MNIGNQISAIRKEHQLTQEKFGELFHVTRQTVSNWENEVSHSFKDTTPQTHAYITSRTLNFGGTSHETTDFL